MEEVNEPREKRRQKEGKRSEGIRRELKESMKEDVGKILQVCVETQKQIKKKEGEGLRKNG